MVSAVHIARCDNTLAHCLSRFHMQEFWCCCLNALFFYIKLHYFCNSLHKYYTDKLYQNVSVTE